MRYAEGEELTLLCGHYKDVDQRVADYLATEERSIGEFVLSGGEAAALAVIDATVRLLPGAISDPGKRAWRLVLRARAECAELYAAAGVSRACGAGGAAVGRPRPDRGVASCRGRAADRGARAPDEDAIARGESDAGPHEAMTVSGRGVTAMLVTPSRPAPWFILAFALSCLLGSCYGFLQGARPFGLVEGIWCLVALRRWSIARRAG